MPNEGFVDRAEYDRLIRERDLWRTKYEAIRAERDKNLPYLIDPQQQTCKVCGRPMKLDFHVPDTLWESVVPEEYRDHVVCLYCFDEYASQKGVDYSNDIEVWFAGEAANLHLVNTAKLAESQAACAEMRGALEHFLTGAKHMSCMYKPDDPDPTWHCCNWSEVVEQIEKVLSSPAGKDLLERLHEAADILQRMREQDAALATMREALEYDGTGHNMGSAVLAALRLAASQIKGTDGYDPKVEFDHAAWLVQKALSTGSGKATLEYIKGLEDNAARRLCEINLDKLRVLDRRNGKVYTQVSSLEWHNSHVAVHVHDPEAKCSPPGMEWPIDCAILMDTKAKEGEGK